MNFRAKTAWVLVVFSCLFASLTVAAQGQNYQASAILKTSTQGLNLQAVFDLYQAKCTNATNPPHPCFLTEQDAKPKTGRPDRILLFRGESSPKDLPASSSFFRWSLESGKVCKGRCSDAELLAYLMGAAKKLRARSEVSYFYRSQDQSWRDDSGRFVSSTMSSQETGLDVLAEFHKIGSGLYFEEQKTKLFDPMVSFSVDPITADLFAQQDGNGKGVLWVASIPKTHIRFLKGSECRFLSPTPGVLYDFNGCVETALNDLEVEVNAVLYLPSEFFFARFLGR